MKKSLLALAVLGAFAGAASAQTNVTIYGVADVGIAFADNGDERTTRMDSGGQSGSRLGFRGTEDLGGGLSASFVLESGYDISNGTMGQGGRLFGRAAWVGLNGAFGSVKLGRQYTPIFIALDTIDPFGTGLMNSGNGITGMFDAHGFRMDNTINYSISTNGVSAQVAYGFGEVAGSLERGRQIGAMVGYKGGPVNVVLAHHSANTTAFPSFNTKTTLLGMTYDLKVVKLHAGVAVNKNDGTLDTRDAMFGVSAPVGAAGTVMAEYIRKDDRRFDNSDAETMGVGYSHALSKRTNFYTSYARNTNDSGVSYNNAARGGETSSLLNVGIRHKF